MQKQRVNLAERLALLRDRAEDPAKAEYICILEESRDAVCSEEALATLSQEELAHQIKLGFVKYTQFDIYLKELLDAARMTVPSNTDNYRVEAIIEAAQALHDKHSDLLLSLQDAADVMAKRAGLAVERA